MRKIDNGINGHIPVTGRLYHRSKRIKQISWTKKLGQYIMEHAWDPCEWGPGPRERGTKRARGKMTNV